MAALACDFFDETCNQTSGCMYQTDECKNCLYPYFHKSHPHKAETVHTGVIDINDEGLPFWNGKLNTLRDGHHEWNFPLVYPGAEHPKLGLGKPSLILTATSGDLFIGGRSPKIIDRVVETIVLSPHIGLFISRYTGAQYRGQMAPYFLSKSLLTVECWRRNVWLGFSAGRQKHFDKRWEDMRPLAAEWFVYVVLAPLLERIVLPDDFLRLAKWVILYGEGEGAPPERCRPMDPRWARSVRDQCAEAGIPFFLRGMAKGAPRPPDLRIRQFPRVP